MFGSYNSHPTNHRSGTILASEVAKLHARLTACFPHVANDIASAECSVLATLADASLRMQEQWQISGSANCRFDIGYHYTKAANIQKPGENHPHLKNIQKRMVLQDPTGRLAGTGTYTSNNPFAHQSLGEIGFLVMRLKGDTEPVQFYQSRSYSTRITGIANGGGSREIVILRNPRQCLPLVTFKSSILACAEGNLAIQTYQQELQKIVDKVGNQSISSRVPAVVSSGSRAPGAVSSVFAGGLLGFTIGTDTMDVSGSGESVDATLNYYAPSALFKNKGCFEMYQGKPLAEGSECSICLSSLNVTDKKDPLVSTIKCKHIFHKSCLLDAMNHSNRCPLCRVFSSEPQGTCPSGKMVVSTKTSLFCQGVTSNGTIVINYKIPSGIQREYNENPGLKFHGITRAAFVPNTPNGRELVKRLKYGFMHGLNFTVGTSVTTGTSNVVTWSSIHHKTTTDRGQHGFPDPGYIVNCNDELTALGVPDADEC